MDTQVALCGAMSISPNGAILFKHSLLIDKLLLPALATVAYSD
jgi:hypothetical protein